MPFEEEVIYLLKYLLVICGGGEAEGEGAKEPKEEPERVAVPGTSVNKDVRKYTRRRELTGEDPEGDDEPPKDKIHVKGDYLTYEEFLKVRKFIFVHHFSGPVDKLSEAVRAEAERAGLTVETFSADLELGQNLMDDEPYKTHRLAASKGKIDGYHSGFPCTTFTKLRWRPCPGMPGPVRSKEHPYGFPDLNVREEEECRVGTVLMARTTVMVDAMYKADRFIKVPCFATVENPPPSEVESHISAWHMPEMVALVDKVPDWRCAHFNTCAYQSNLEPGTRHYKPQMIGGNLPGIEALNRSCQCGNRPHEPVVGKERSKKSAEYPDEFCAAYAVLAVRHFTKMAQAEFLEGRLVLLNNRINYLKGATADTVQEAEDIDESSNQIMEGDDFQRGLTIKRLFVEVQDKERKKRRRVQKPEGERQQEEAREEGEPGGEKNSPPAADVADLPKGPSASSSSQVTWSGGHGKHGMLKEPKGKNEVPRALVYIGGMRDPHRSVLKLPTVQSLGAKMWERWESFIKEYPKALDVAETYGTEDCHYEQEIVEKWRSELCEMWGTPVPGVVLTERGEYKSPVYHEMVRAWTRKSGDPDIHVANWLQHGAPLGIERDIPTAGIFPPAEEATSGMAGCADADAALEKPDTLRNYKSVEDDLLEANIELDRYEGMGYLKRIDLKTAEENYKGGTVSRLGLVVKTKENGEKKRRIVIDLRRSGGNAKSTLPERLVLPRLLDAIKLIKEIRKRVTPVSDSNVDAELELALVDVSDAFTVLPVAPEELKHTLAPSTVEGEMLVFQALLFGYKVAPLLYSRFASWLARLLQAGVRLDKGGHEVYLDDALWVLCGSLKARSTTLSYVLNTMGALGVKVALKKGSRASSATWIGVALNLVDRDTLVVGLPTKFIDELSGILNKWENAGYAPLKELRSVAGKSAWLGGVLPRARWVTSVFYAVLTQTLKEEEEQDRSSSATRNRKGLFAVKRLELARRWMLAFLAAAKLRPMRRITLSPKQMAEVRIITDASPEALGGLLLINGKIVRAFFSTMEQKQTDALLVEYKSSASQGVLEALAILVAMRRWSEKIKGMTLQLAVQGDSITALALTQKLSAKSTSPGLNFIGAELAICLEELAVEEILTLHVPGKANVEADFLSRPSTWGDVSMPEALSGVDIEPENGPNDSFYRLPTPLEAPPCGERKVRRPEELECGRPSSEPGRH